MRGLSAPARSEHRSVASVRARLGAEDGVTLTEMLVVMLILLIILAGMTTLFVSAANTESDQSNRYQAQHNARLALDGLRREIRCASAVTASSATLLTITLPGYCQKPVAATAASFTWCMVGGTAPYALWRYAGTLCSGTGIRKAEFLRSTSVFSYNRATAGPVQNAPTVGPTEVFGFFKPGIYSYAVTALTSAGEISGSIRSVEIATGSPNEITVSWSAYAGATSYNVYGREDGSTTTEGLRLLTSTASTSYVDFGCAPLADGCGPAVVTTTSMATPPLAAVEVSLDFDLTTADGKQRFKLEDDIVLRNSGRY